ncbi:MAG: carbohydrate-binding domain-containing protein [Propionibacteriaceae bacterium]|jgi:hypothetical protein|nr:carbohydrate-binding domain-containing protein [Propionibacteriaceae bacterium]
MTSYKHWAIAGACATALALGGCSAVIVAQPGSTTTGSGTVTEATAPTVPDSVAAVLASSLPSAAADADFTWDAASEIAVNLSDSGSTGGAGVVVAGGVVTITAPGTYRVSGTLSDGQLVVDGTGQGLVRLILDGATVTNSSSSALTAKGVDKLVIVLAQGSTNTLTDATSYVYPDAATTEPDAALFSDPDLIIGGDGALTINARSQDGITSKDGLVIAGGAITVNSTDDAIKGRDYLIVSGGTLNIDAAGQGLKSTNDEDEGAGYVLVSGGTVAVHATGETDCVNAVTSALISGGTMTLSCTADAIHADKQLVVDDGTITVTESVEGLESAVLVINGGTVDVTSSDDALNATDGTGSSSTGGMGDWGGGGGMMPGDGSMPSGFPTDGSMPQFPGDGSMPSGMPTDRPAGMPTDMPSGMGDGSGGQGFPGRGGGDGSGMGGGMGGEAVEAATLVIRGGTVTLNAQGDGLDSNGTVVLSGGEVVVYGPTNSGNGAIDVAGSFEISGGVLIAAGSSGMPSPPDETSSQRWFSQNLTLAAGDTITITSGGARTEFTSAKTAQNIVVSTPDLGEECATITMANGTTTTAQCYGG